jgi:rhodanese-related sulfurtransferase
MIKRLVKFILLFAMTSSLVSCGVVDDSYQMDEQEAPAEQDQINIGTGEYQLDEEPAQTEAQDQVEVEYIRITSREAEDMMLSEDVVILDVRTQEEFDEGHIPNAILLPSFEVRERALSVVTDFDQIILVYCRAGSRSAAAARELISMGYMRVYDFGGINGWHGEIVR